MIFVFMLPLVIVVWILQAISASNNRVAARERQILFAKEAKRNSDFVLLRLKERQESIRLEEIERARLFAIRQEESRLRIKEAVDRELASLNAIYIAEKAIAEAGIADEAYLNLLDSNYQSALIAYNDIVPNSMSIKNGKYKWKSKIRKANYLEYCSMKNKD